jgi:hypothetical protein
MAGRRLPVITLRLPANHSANTSAATIPINVDRFASRLRLASVSRVGDSDNLASPEQADATQHITVPLTVSSELGERGLARR